MNRWTSSRYQTLPAAYVYADVLERMYLHTQYADYKKRLVEWVKIRQRIGPADAWAYAKEYRYSEVPAHRQSALAMALFLDPNSATLKGVSAAEAAAARALLEQDNPFVLRKVRAGTAMRTRVPGETVTARIPSVDEHLRAH